MSQAIQHALASGSITGEWAEGARLVRFAGEETVQRGGLSTVGGWLTVLPDAEVRTDCALAMYRAWVLALNGELSKANEYTRAAAAAMRVGEAPAADLGKLLTLQGFVALFGAQDYERALDLANDALKLLAEDQMYWRVMALWTVAESQERTRHVNEAIATLREARRAGRLLDGQVFSAPAELFLATTLQLHGERREAVAVCQEALEWYTDEEGRISPVAGMILSRLGALCHEANRLEQALEYLKRGLALSEQLAMDSPMMYALGFSAPTLHALGRTDEALEALQKAHQHASRSGLADADWCLALEANIRLDQGDLTAVERWAQEAGVSTEEEPQYLRMDSYLVYARLLLRQERVLEARGWLKRLDGFAQERGLVRYWITIQILQALAAEQAADAQSAGDALGRAARVAAPEAYLRAFLDEGPRVLSLLGGVRHVVPRFVDRVLNAGTEVREGEPSSSRGPAEQPLFEPLSERELEVLGLIAAGLSNREIAERLVIAVGTVKRHINNLYGKMQVRRRTEAVARGREMGLL
jgi:LuxR family maltose regulon positive regulatory protein